MNKPHQKKLQQEDGKPDTSGRYDLEERTATFAENLIRFAMGIKLSAVTDPLVRQVVRSSSSIGANYCEANKKGLQT